VKTALAWGAILVVAAVRGVIAAHLPLTGDEAYYWEWSRRLAGGYTDHPPAVAFAIAAFSWIGHSPLAVRIAFVFCGLGTALFSAGAANTLAQDRRAGITAALCVSLAPLLNVAFATASPDGPYALFWALSLYLAAKAYRSGAWIWYGLAGAAIGGALLSRFFAVALLFGVIAAAPRGAKKWLIAAVALLVWSPFIAWNATHGWASVTFALLQRHETQIALLRPVAVFALAALAFSPGVWIAGSLAQFRPKYSLLFWTAVPLSVALLLLAFRERVEIYWFTGPFISMCVAAGCAYGARAWILAPAVVLTALVVAAGLAPASMFAVVQHGSAKLADGGPFELLTYPRLAQDVRRAAAMRGAIVLTDGYGFSSLLDFYANTDPVVIGYNPQGQEAYRWFNGPRQPRPALFIDKVPLRSRPDFMRQLNAACSRVTAGPTLSYRVRRYYTTWCEGASERTIALLRWHANALHR
jgi:4-amino-4-deoxy-L-arabinose transferase-like glycosyltransferase